MSKFKTKEDLLKDLTKANKVRKEYLANRAGFDSVEAYKKHLQSVDSAPIVEKSTTDSVESLDMVIAFDTTGSMASYIQDVKQQVKDLIKKMFNQVPDLRLKIVAFGDYCDMVNETKFGKAFQSIELTNDELSLVEFVSNAENTAGGDADEFYELVIKKVVEETDWREGIQKTFLLIGDANPHEVGYTYSGRVKNAQVDWKQEAEKANKLGIKIDTLSIHGNAFYKKVSEITGGLNVPFKKAKGVSQVIEGLTYARTNSVAFEKASLRAVASGDTELIGAYKSMSTLL